MKHTYLSQTAIKKALENKAITEKEAFLLKKKVDRQVFIGLAINK